jgi:hypothetical protein
MGCTGSHPDKAVTVVGGKGGGRADMARAGGSDVDALPAALASIETYLRERLLQKAQQQIPLISVTMIHC